MEVEAVAAIDVRLEDMDDGPTWPFRPLEESARERVEQMLNDGMTPGEIVAELDVTRSYVYRIRRDMGKAQGPSNDAQVVTPQRKNSSIDAPADMVCTSECTAWSPQCTKNRHATSVALFCTLHSCDPYKYWPIQCVQLCALC